MLLVTIFYKSIVIGWISSNTFCFLLTINDVYNVHIKIDILFYAFTYEMTTQ